MKVIIICESVHHGNTLKVAEAMASACDEGQVVNAEQAFKLSFAGDELVGFGSGIYFSRFHKKIEQAAASIELPEGIPLFVFSTSGLGKRSYNNGLMKMLEKRGADVKGTFACKGFDTYGHPAEKDLEHAVAFIQGLIKKR